MVEAFDSFWSVYSNLVLTLGTNALLAIFTRASTVELFTKPCGTWLPS